MYPLLIFVHIVAAIAWFGTGLFYQLQMTRLRSVSGHGEVGAQMEWMRWTEKGIFRVDVTILTLILVLMVFKPGL